MRKPENGIISGIRFPNRKSDGQAINLFAMGYLFPWITMLVQVIFWRYPAQPNFRKKRITERRELIFCPYRWLNFFNPNYALEANPTNALVGFNPDLATLGFHQKGFL